MEANFICPCCGHHAEFSTSFCELTRKVIDDYFDLQTVKPLLWYETRVRGRRIFAGEKLSKQMWLVYFIRKMTGEGYKTIWAYLGIGHSVPAKYVIQVQVNIDTLPQTQEHATVMQNIIRREYNAEKYFQNSKTIKQ
jgi:hypothetical protein